MTLQDVLTLALDFAYLAVLVVAVGEYRRRRQPVSLAVVAVFAAVFVVFAASTVGRFVPQIGLVSGFAAFAAFIALPVLTINLVSHFQSVPPWLVRGSAAVAVLLVVATIGLTSQTISTTSATRWRSGVRGSAINRRASRTMSGSARSAGMASSRDGRCSQIRATSSSHTATKIATATRIGPSTSTTRW